MISILDLNRDCLNKIFSYLNIYELIDIEETCDAFKVICADVYCSKKFHKIRFELRYLKIEYLTRILTRIGAGLRELEFSGGYLMSEAIKEELVDGISTHCKRLTKLSVNYVQFDKKLFDKFQCCFCNLACLDLSRCAISELASGLQLNADSLNNLKELKLAGNSNMSGAFFKDLTMIETLDVSYCYELRYYEFLQFLKNCKKLISLNLTASPQVIPEDQSIFEDLSLHQPFLEVLIMDNVGINCDEETLKKFKNLKNFSASGRRFGT